MVKSIFVPLQGLACDAQALSMAVGVARSFDAHLDCIHLRPDPRLLVAATTAGMETGFGTGVLPAELWNTLVEADAQRSKEARKFFEAACARYGIAKDSKGISASFREIQGDPAKDLTSQARYADLVVLARDTMAAETSWDVRGDVIVGCGRPVLLSSAKSSHGVFRNVAIAWKDTAEAARAVTAAMPVLTKAERIVVLSAREGGAKVEDALRSAEHIAALLRRHSLAVRAEHVPSEHAGIAKTVIDRALTLESDAIVMGAYGHGRLREFVFGGFTRHVLNEARLPVLLAH
jgi:nucleotide-binding universal stress UspA family protein